jgi:hypothetical protein
MATATSAAAAAGEDMLTLVSFNNSVTLVALVALVAFPASCAWAGPARKAAKAVNSIIAILHLIFVTSNYAHLRKI